MRETVGHTPGPWTVTENTYPPYIMAGPFMVAQVADADVGPQCAANADLIAAAPDLLAVCLEIAEHGTDDWDARMLTLRAAISRAEGGAA